jgi:putative Mg2+ transporter-C (MgtC) family protein
VNPDSTTLSLSGGVVARMLVAALLGGLVGAEREASDQPAGLRTHIAVALGAALFGAISTLGFVEFDQRRANTVLQADVTRVASNVVVGIGFLGAGVIFRQGGSIKNLTTAASLWTVAAIGLACGVGDLGMAAIGTVVLLVSLVVLRPIRSLIRDRFGTGIEQVRIEMTAGADTGDLLAVLDRVDHVEVDSVRIERGAQTVVVIALVRPKRAGELRRLLAAASAVPGVETVMHD